jgi:8-oxo-dGTP diphosphatase
MIHVTCAVIRNEEEEVLIVQRGKATDHPLKWEFPGGKIADGETKEECIIREVQEELSMEIVICSQLPDVEHNYGNKQIKLFPFICDTLDEEPFLNEHVAYRWIASPELVSVDFSEADLFVVKSYLDKIEVEKTLGENFNPDDAELRSMVNNMIDMKEVEWVAKSAIDNQAILLKLLEYSHSQDKKLAFRASWTLTKVYDKFPGIIYPYLTRIIETIINLDNESVQRSFLRIISLSDINKMSSRQHGILTEFCFTALNSGFSAIAIKAYSMEILYKLALKYPELTNELSASIKMLQAEGSAGIMARGRIILKKLAEAPIEPKSSQSLS